MLAVAAMLDNIQRTLFKRFAQGSWLSKESNYLRFLDWNTFFRRNMALFAMLYLEVRMHLYQIIFFHLMALVPTFCLVAARATAKSFIIALYACCKAILYPGSRIVIAAGNKNQARLLVVEKIRNELMNMSPNLAREIASIRDGQSNETIVTFTNGSTITAILSSDRARGYRSNVSIYEEFRQINKKDYDSVLVPFRVVRQPPYILTKEYNDVPELKEEPQEIFISSAWRQSHWMWDVIKDSCTSMLENGDAYLMAADYSVTMKYGLRSRKQLERERKKLDPISWMIEYQNLMLTDSMSCYFQYGALAERQVLTRAFYPRKAGETLRSKLINNIPRQEGEIRILSCDIAMMDGAANDNSCFVCLRMLPESDNRKDDSGDVSFGYRIQVPYIETRNGEETLRQTIRIKQLMYDWDADYVVLDAKNFGISVYDTGARVLYDEERSVEYRPWRCMNNPEIAKRINNRAEKENVYCVIASSKYNSDAAVTLRQMLSDGKIEFLVNPGEAAGYLNSHMDGYITMSGEEQMFYDLPYLETAQLINETSSLEYERLENGMIRIHEVGKARKDRYSALSYGCSFAAEIERSMYYNENIDLSNIQGCVSSIMF